MLLGEAYYRQAVQKPSRHRQQATRAVHYQPQVQARMVCDALGFSGPITIISNACASGGNAIGHAWDLIRHGQAERVVAGGYDALGEMVFSGFDSLQALSPTVCRPFDARRDGLALGEGAAVVNLETLESARRRGAEILGELVGYGTAIDQHHLTQPHPQGSTTLTVMKQACASAGVTPDEVDYINAHGTGTVLNDSSEALAISEWAGRRATTLPVSSTKAGIGHLLGGAGAVEAVVCLMTLREQWLPPEIEFRISRSGLQISGGEQTTGRTGECRTVQFVWLRRRECGLDFEEVGMSRIFVTGIGAVSPAGWNVAALRDALDKGEPLPVQTLPRPGWEEPLPARLVPNPLARPEFLAHPRLRRTSPITHYAAAAALEAVAGLRTDPAAKDCRLGIVVCTQSGCVQYSCRFYDETLKNPATASPLIFPETVYAAPASHVAALLGNVVLAYSLVGDPSAFLQGVSLGVQWLDENRVDACLVIGAEETNWILADALWHLDRRAIVTAGAGALCLCREPEFPAGVELAAVTDAHTYSARLNRTQAAKAMRNQLGEFDCRARREECSPERLVTSSLTNQDKIGKNSPGELLCDGIGDSPRTDAAERAAWRDWTGPRVSPKRILGEGLMAAAAWQCVSACDVVANGRFAAANVSLVGSNQQAIGAQFMAVAQASCL